MASAGEVEAYGESPDFAWWWIAAFVFLILVLVILVVCCRRRPEPPCDPPSRVSGKGKQ
jgi:ABC-type microcin C transport system permease subunit YejE